MDTDKSPKILDCTLRDGSYAINFTFSESDTQEISSNIDKLNIPYIEVGHGVGLGANRLGVNFSSATDIAYMRAAKTSVKQGKWGMFCIPGIANLDDVKLACDHGIQFIRIGSNIDQIEDSKKFIELARNLGIEVFANFMKSYTQTPKKFAKLMKQSYEYGSELIYLVDSAGGMLPKELIEYIYEANNLEPKIPLGFHGHNNLGLAMANALICAEQGVDIIDSSFQGLGRSSGNVPTEQLICALHRANYEIEIDPIEAMHFGETYIRPRIKNKGHCSLDVMAGYAQFHSSYMPDILDIAREFNVDPREIIHQLCKIDKLNAPKNLIRDIAGKIEKNKFSLDMEPPWNNYFGNEQDF